MATTAEALIMEVLFARLSSLVLSPVHQIAWPNVSFTPPQSGGQPSPYLRVQFVPNQVNRALIDSDGPHQHVGLFQVSVYGPKGAGESETREIAGLVAAHFPADLRMVVSPVVVRVSKRPDVAGMLVEDAMIQIPVMIAWEAYA